MSFALVETKFQILYLCLILVCLHEELVRPQFVIIITFLFSASTIKARRLRIL